jgi:hypothetical protein
MQCGLASRIPGAHDKDVAAFHGPHADDTADRDLPNSPYQKPIKAAPAAPLARRQRRRFGGSPVVGAVAVPLAGLFVAVLLAGLLTLLSWVLEKGSSRQRSQGRPTGPSGQASQRLAAANLARSPPQIPHDPGHTAEAARSHLPRVPMRRLRSPRRWRIAYAQAGPVQSSESREDTDSVLIVAAGIGRSAFRRKVQIPPTRLAAGL